VQHILALHDLHPDTRYVDTSKREREREMERERERRREKERERERERERDRERLFISELSNAIQTKAKTGFPTSTL
jgi:hypothetical protein